MLKRISSLILVIVMLVTLLPNVYAADETKNPYEGISLGDDLDGANNTTYRVESGQLGYIGPDQHYWYNNVDFGKQGPMKAELVMKSNSNYAKGTVVIRLDSEDGPVVAEFPMEEAFKEISSYSMLTMEFDITTEITGIHNVYMFTANGTADYYSLKFIEKPDQSKLFVEYDESVNAFSDIANNKYRYDINLVSGLGIDLADEEAEKLHPDYYMTRGKFADVILDLIDGEIVEAERAFSDVPEDNPYYDSINKIAALGYMQGVGDGRFLPGNYITLKDAAACAVNLLGYNVIAESKGGYSSGYLTVANRESLLDGLDNLTHLTNGAAARFIKNIIRAEYYDITRVTSNGEAEYNRFADGILSKTKNIFRGIGLVEGNGISLVNSPDTSLSDDAVLINGEVFQTGETYAKALLGYECEYFYQSIDGENVLMQILPSEKTTKIVIDSMDYDITEITSSEIVYEDRNFGDSDTLELDYCHIIYNNVNLDRPLSDVITYPFRGKITYVDNRGRTDALIIDNYRNIKVESYNEDTSLLKDKISGEVFKTSEMNFFLTLNGEGALLTNEFMKNVELGMLYISQNRTGEVTARLIADQNSVCGMVESIDSGIAIINGTEYTVDTNAVESLGLSPIKAGFTANFQYNRYNEIAYYELADNEGLQTGYLVNWEVNNPGSLRKECHVRIIGMDNLLSVYTFAENVKIDGKRYRKDDDKSEAINASAENAPVRYSLDENGNINVFDTIIQCAGTLRGSDSDDMLVLASTTATNDLVWTADWSAFLDKSDNSRMKMVSDENTMAFSTYGDMEDWGFVSLISLSQNSFDGKGYSSNEVENVIDVLVTTRKPGSGSSKVVTFDKKSKVINEDDEICTKIICYSGDQTYEYIVEDDAVEKQVSALKKGDLFSLVDGGGVIKDDITVIMFADGSVTRPYDGGALNAVLYYTDDAKLGQSGDGCDSWGYTAGVITKKFGDFVEIKLAGASTDELVYAYYKLNTSSQFVTKYTSDFDYVEVGCAGSDIQVGDVVCVTMYQKVIKGVHAIVDSVLAGKVD